MTFCVFAQKASTLNVNIINNTFKHVDLINSYGSERTVFASADVVNDAFTLTADILNDIYRLDFGDGNAMLIVLSPGETVNLTLDANQLQDIVSVTGSESMNRVKEMSNLTFKKMNLLDSINEALQNDPEKIYWSDFAQKINLFRQTNDDVDGYISNTYNNIDSLNAIFATYMPAGKISNKYVKYCGDEVNKWLKKLEINYNPFASYLENVNRYYTFSETRMPNSDKLYSDFDQYMNHLHQKHKVAEQTIGPIVKQTKKLLAVRDSLAFNNLLNNKNVSNWLKDVYNNLSNELNDAAQKKDEYTKFIQSDSQIADVLVSESQDKVKNTVAVYQKTFDNENNYLNQLLINDIKKYKDDICVLMFLDNFPKEQHSTLHNEVIAALNQKYPDHRIVSERWKIMNSPASRVVIGAIAPDLEFPNPEGKLLKLSDLRGKVVLIDFWASWCGPCRRENPNVTRIYEKYHDKGFEVYSVSLDSDAGSWKRAIESDKLVWPNHVSDLKKWQSKAAATYGVNSIPSTFLLDRDGRIVQKNLRGADLERAVQRLLEN